MLWAKGADAGMRHHLRKLADKHAGTKAGARAGRLAGMLDD